MTKADSKRRGRDRRRPARKGSGPSGPPGKKSLASEDLEKSAGRRRIVKFLLLFVFFWVVFFFAAWVFTDELMILCPWTAAQASWALRLVGVESSSSGTLLSFGSKSVTIVMECTALQVAMIYTALVLAYPSSIKAKLIGVGAGLPLILLVNIIRLMVICFVLWWKPQYFEMMHIYIWQVVFIVVVVAMAALWIEKVVHRERRAALPS